MIRLGAPVYMTNSYYPLVLNDPEALAQLHKEKGYRAAYAPPVPLHNQVLINGVKSAFAKADVMLAEVGYWGNLMDTDLTTRKQNRQKAVDALFLAEVLQANCAVALAGSYCRGAVTAAHSPENFTKDAFAEAVDIARYLIDTVKPKHTCFSYEIYQFGVVDSIAAIVALIKAIDRPQFGVHLDLTNLINCPRLYYKSAQLAADCARAFGSKIVAAHAKDLRMEAGATVMLKEVPSGQGGLDIGACMGMLHSLPQTVPYMMEHLQTQEAYHKAAAYLRQTAAQHDILL